MSIASEITRLQNDSSAIASAIAAKGVTVPSGSGYDDYASLIAQIGGSLPYTPVSYIQSDGTAYIDTGLKIKTPFSVSFKMTPVLPASGNAYFMGSRLTDNSTRMSPFVYSSAGYAQYAYSTGFYVSSASISISTSATNATPIDVLVEFRSGYQGIDIKQAGETEYAHRSNSVSGNIDNDLNFYVFGQNSSGVVVGRPPSGTRLFSLKIYDNVGFVGLVFCGVPCYYNGEYGLWDMVSETFYGNANDSGAFTGA